MCNHERCAVGDEPQQRHQLLCAIANALQLGIEMLHQVINDGVEEFLVPICLCNLQASESEETGRSAGYNGPRLPLQRQNTGSVINDPRKATYCTRRTFNCPL